MEFIRIRGAREHNLKNIDIDIPRNKLVVVTGLSGSGKSTLAFDTIYAEGQRRYVESLSAYARQFLQLLDKPDVDFVEGLSPAIAIQQRAPSYNPRSTVGTVTEIYDYLRLLYARVGKPHCPACGRVIEPQTVQQIVDTLLSMGAGVKLQILAPLVRGRKGEYRELFTRLQREGYARIRIDGKVYGLEEEIKLNKMQRHDIELVVDRVVPEDNKETRERVADSVETALKMGQGVMAVAVTRNSGSKDELKYFSEHHSCVTCGISLPEISPRLFSFNAPYGACPECTGLGTKIEVDPDLVVPDKSLSVNTGAVLPWRNPITTRRNRWKGAWTGYYNEILTGVSQRHGIDLDKPFKELSKEEQNILLYGDGDYEGVINNLDRRYRETESEFVKEEIFGKYIRSHICPVCNGGRLKPEVLAVTVGGKNVVEVTAMSITQAAEFFGNLNLTQREQKIAYQVLKEINARVKFLLDVGLDYLTIGRNTMTLSGGEAARIHLATQIGSGLVGVLYVLDEPTIGLHARDNHRLVDTMTKLRDIGNTVLVVEHDENVIRKADWVIDLGPGAGSNGGEVIAQGTLEQIRKVEASLTGQYFNGILKIPLPSARREGNGKKIEIIGAKQFNLKNIDTNIPLGKFVCVTGVSGSGKSTLVHEILYKSLAQELYHSKEKPGSVRTVKGIENIDKVIIVNQAPIGRTPRSNPVTYTGVFAHIRDIFARLPEAKRRGYQPGRFSFNVKGGRCEACQGDGMTKIEMQFLPDVYVKCDVCQGRRFNEETLAVRYKEKSIYDVLEMPVDEAVTFFENIHFVQRVFKTISDVGLGYIKLGQPATTLSGGEAQRVKLASELCRRATGKTLYILDEPTTGLHFADVAKLLDVLQRLVDNGNTVLIIEHNLEVVKSADWIIDLGPEGGHRGGFVVAEGTPEAVVKNTKSYTGSYLKTFLDK
ncbi:MAG: excinuclease ABC subunit UvrA [Elusimicrobiota bacterium]